MDNLWIKWPGALRANQTPKLPRMAENPNLLEGEFEFKYRGAIPLTFGIKGRFSANFIARALDFLHQEAYIIRRDRRKRKNKWYIC